MSESQGQSGSCLCGSVIFTLASQEQEVSSCHCDMCLRWCGGPMMALHVKGPVAFEGEENIVRYRSSDWAERGFCAKCGSNLFYFLIPTGEYVMSAGALNDKSGLELANQIFIDEKPGWYAFANDTPKLTGAEVVAMYAPKEE